MSIPRRIIRVYIAGVQTPVRDIRTEHDVDQPVGTGSLVLRAPRPAHVALGARVAIQAGYDNVVVPIFHGRISEDESAFSEDGGTIRVDLEGNGRLLWYRNRIDNYVNGPVRLDVLFRTFCKNRGVPLYHADTSTNPDATLLTFGGINQVDSGYVPFPSTSSPGDVLDRIGRHYGYRTFDTPLGFHRLQKISGLPAFGDVVRAYEEGVDMHEVRRSRSIDRIANEIEVWGAEYTAGDGTEVAVHSQAAAIPGNPLLGPFGVSKMVIRDDAIVTNTMAANARQVAEIDRSATPFRYSWTVRGDPERQPGEVVSVKSPTVMGDIGFAATVPAVLWLMRVAHTITESRWTTTMEGWYGGGQALPTGNDCTTITSLDSGGRHFGNEYLSHYRRPNPDGLRIRIPFAVPNDYTTMTVRGYHHGSNSFVRNQGSEATRFEVWQPFVDNTRPVASGELPQSRENLESRLPYASSGPFVLEDGSTTNNPWYFWSKLVVPLSGSLAADPTGSNTTFEIVSGKDSDVGDYDDGEVAALTLETCGATTPAVIV